MVQVIGVETVDNGVHVLDSYMFLKFYCDMCRVLSGGDMWFYECNNIPQNNKIYCHKDMEEEAFSAFLKLMLFVKGAVRTILNTFICCN